MRSLYQRSFHLPLINQKCGTLYDSGEKRTFQLSACFESSSIQDSRPCFFSKQAYPFGAIIYCCMVDHININMVLPFSAHVLRKEFRDLLGGTAGLGLAVKKNVYNSLFICVLYIYITIYNCLCAQLFRGCNESISRSSLKGSLWMVRIYSCIISFGTRVSKQRFVWMP